MKNSYPTHEAKARFSEILRRVRNGQRVEITYHGETVAEIRPVTPGEPTLAVRIAHLEETGMIAPPASRTSPILPLLKKRGALKRFLEERD